MQEEDVTSHHHIFPIVTHTFKLNDLHKLFSKTKKAYQIGKALLDKRKIMMKIFHNDAAKKEKVSDCSLVLNHLPLHAQLCEPVEE